MSDHRTETVFCERCGRELAESDPAPVCAQCAVEVADGRMSQAREISAPSASAHRAFDTARLRRWGTPVLAAVLTLVLFVQLPAMVEAFADPPPGRDGIVATDAVGDRCVANLWTIAAALAEHRPMDTSLVCPASGRPYAKTSDAGVMTISCPDPASHGAASLSVRSDALVPAVR
jgi:hypothetical protein